VPAAPHGKSTDQLKADLESLGWECREHGIVGDWTVTVSKGGKSIVNTGTDRKLAWNAAYRDAIRYSAKDGA
jgi:hypothetical protein